MAGCTHPDRVRSGTTARRIFDGDADSRSGVVRVEAHATHVQVAHPSRAERAAAGKAARSVAPRSSHADWAPPADRRDPVAMLEDAGATRVPELVPIRYGRMLVSPFTFYRGARRPHGRRPRGDCRAPACTRSSAATRTSRTSACSPRPTGGWSSASTTSTRRCPARSSGTSSGSSRASRSPGATAASTPPQRERVDLAAVRAYREAMREFAAMRDARRLVRALDVDDADRPLGHRRATAKQLQALRAQRREGAHAGQHAGALDQAHASRRRPSARIISDPPLIVPIEELSPPGERARRIEALVRGRGPLLPAARCRAIAASCSSASATPTPPARSSASAASARARGSCCCSATTTATRCSCRSRRPRRRCSSRTSGASEFAQHGQRVVEGQRLMQAASDILLGWVRPSGVDGVERDFYVRQLWDGKGSALVEAMDPSAHGGLRARSAAGRSPARTPAPATRSRSPPTSGQATRSTGRSPSSPRPTPTRTSATTRRSERPSTRGGWRPRRGCDGRTPRGSQAGTERVPGEPWWARSRPGLRQRCARRRRAGRP